MAEFNDIAARWTRLRDHLESALEHIHDHAVVLIDPDGRIAGWNTGAERVLGHSAQEAMGEPNDLFFTPEDRRTGAPKRELDTAALLGAANDDRWHLRRNGSRFFGSGTVTAVRDREGTLLGFVKIFRDLTDQRRTLERLAESEERYRLLVNSVKDYAIYMLDTEGCVSYWTAAAERIKGYASHEIIGKPFGTFFMPDDRARGVPDRELQAAREHGRFEAAGWRVRKDGSCFWAEEIVTALHDASGAFVGYSKITRDTTERRQAELERERLLRDATEANRLKDEFLSTMSHELRTPLNAIVGWLQLLRLRNEVPDHLSEALAVVERNAHTQARLIDDLLNASRIVTGKETLTLARISFAEPLAAAVETVKPDAYRKRVDLIVRHDVADDAVTADAGRLQQIIWNLLANAVKFTPPDGRVTLTTSSTEKHIELSVVDTGIGIEAAFLPFVFDRFRQADTAHDRLHGGLGLGLAIVKHLVDLHGGHIEVVSDGRRQGTSVRLRIPRDRRIGRTALRPDPPRRAASGGRALPDVKLLVVEDDADARRMLELVLSAQGARVTVSASTSEGMAAARAFHPDIVLADLAMPVEDGFALLAQLRADAGLRGTPVVALTAYARNEDRLRCLAAGFDGYLSKPVDMNQMIDIVVQLLAKRRSSSGPDRSNAARDSAPN